MLALACLPLLGGGCSEERARGPVGDDLGDELESAPPVELTDFCGRYMGALCNRRQSCRQFGKVPNPYTPCAEWVLTLQRACEEHWRPLPGAGLATYNADAAGRCVKLLQIAPCGDVLDDPDLTQGCVRQAFKGAAAEGAACHSHPNCADGLVCDLSDSCPGRCVAEPESVPLGVIEGGACGDGVGECGFGLGCFGGVCMPHVRVGRACGEGFGPCDPYRGWCKPDDDGGVSACAPLPGAGEECGLGKAERCSESVCDPAVGFCITPPRAAGGTCDPDAPDVCESWSCGEAGVCDAVGWPYPSCPVPEAEDDRSPPGSPPTPRRSRRTSW